jgi:hypothetical protein
MCRDVIWHHGCYGGVEVSRRFPSLWTWLMTRTEAWAFRPMRQMQKSSERIES